MTLELEWVNVIDLESGMQYWDGQQARKIASVTFSHNVGRWTVVKVVFMDDEPQAAPAMFSTRKPVQVVMPSK